MTAEIVKMVCIVLIALAIAVAHVYIVVRLNQQHAEERQLLLDRIQAKNLAEYKALNFKSPKKLKPVEGKKPDHLEQI